MKKKPIKILAIETSCDETAAAVIEELDGQPVILSNIISSQIDLHAKTGGVVPEVASRAHMETIHPVIALALLSTRQGIPNLDLNENCKLEIEDYQESIRLLDDITHIAVTAGPGLIGSLLVGFNAAKSLAYARNLPIIGVNHIEGHIYSVFDREFPISNFQFPILALTVSGGHTSLNLMTDHGKYTLLGDTIDDAVGEAYDKVGKLLGLGYPGGPAISKLAGQFRENLKSDYNGVVFPRPIINDGTFNFSLSGLKTAVLIQAKKKMALLDIEKSTNLPQEIKEEFAYAFEEAVADVLIAKTVRAIEKFSPKTVIFAGGVSANKYLQDRLRTAIAKFEASINFLTPPKELTGDNAAMIGLAGYYNIKNGKAKNWSEITIDSNWELS